MAAFVLFVFTVFLLPVARSKGGTESISDQHHPCPDGKTSPCKATAQKKPCEKWLAVNSLSTLSIDHIANKSFSETCLDSSNNLIGSFYFDFGDGSTLEFTSQVCIDNTDCSHSLEEPPLIMYKNGKYCPKCFRTGDSKCDADGEVFCEGDAMNCTEVNGEITQKDSSLKNNITILFAGRGCVTRSVCGLEKKSFQLGNQMFIFKSLQCTKANGALSSLRLLAFTLEKKDLGPQLAFFFPCILGIFAVKMLS